MNFVETTTNSTDSAFWCHKSTKSHQLARSGSIAEVQSSESSQVVWPMRQNEADAGYNMRTRLENAWPPSPLVNVSLNFFRNPAPVELRTSKDEMCDQVEKGKKLEISTGCRLFGFNLTNSNSAVIGTAIAPSHVDENPGTFQSPKLQKQNASETSTKEIKAKHGTTSSTRTRTKVNHVVSVSAFLYSDLSRYSRFVYFPKGSNARDCCWSCY